VHTDNSRYHLFVLLFIDCFTVLVEDKQAEEDKDEEGKELEEDEGVQPDSEPDDPSDNINQDFTALTSSEHNIRNQLCNR
jgi:hypothetical protein